MEGELKKAPAVKRSTSRRGSSRRRADAQASPDEIISGLWERARYGSYFDCLGISVDAGTSDVRGAWLTLSGMLGELRGEAAAGNPEWLSALDQVAKVGADAFEVLSDPDLRLAYVRALA